MFTMIDIETYKNNFAILVVDDNDDNIFTLTRRLEKEGYHNLQVAKNGIEALEKIHNGSYDLVLLDLTMPDMNGIEVLTKIKSSPDTEHIMVMMISGDDRIENVVSCIKLGAEDFLQKPFNVELLKARVGNCLKKKWYDEKERIYKEKIEFERKQYQQLLEATFPQKIIGELAENKSIKPNIYPKTAIIFTDISGFTSYCSMHSPQEVFENMQSYVNLCEKLSVKYNLEKIKTIGDAFMATAGMFIDTKNPVLSAVEFAFNLLSETSHLSVPWDLHIGIDYGDVVAGIVGNSKYLFDVWGDKVNTAARIQSIAEPNKVYLSKDALEMIKDKCQWRALDSVNLKGKGMTEIFEVTSLNQNANN